MTGTLPASRIAVADFRLVLQWPLILEVEAGPGLTRRLTDEVGATRQALSRCNWTETSGLEMLATPGQSAEAAADASYGEFAYFHDFLQGVLYPRTGDATVSIQADETHGPDHVHRLVASKHCLPHKRMKRPTAVDEPLLWLRSTASRTSG